MILFPIKQFLKWQNFYNLKKISTNQILNCSHNYTIKDCSSRIIADKISSDMKLIFLEIKIYTYKHKKKKKLNIAIRNSKKLHSIVDKY